MEKDKKFRALAIAAICIAIVCVSVAFAALSATLSISGTATVSTASAWKIQFTDVPSSLTTTGGASQVGNFTSDGSIISWSAKFTAPGDSISFAAKVSNTGSIDAVLSDITKSIGGAAANYFTYNVKLGTEFVTDNTLPASKRLLNSGSTADIVVTVIFDENKALSASELTDLSTSTATFTLGLTFTQVTSADSVYTSL